MRNEMFRRIRKQYNTLNLGVTGGQLAPFVIIRLDPLHIHNEPPHPPVNKARSFLAHLFHCALGNLLLDNQLFSHTTTHRTLCFRCD